MFPCPGTRARLSHLPWAMQGRRAAGLQMPAASFGPVCCRSILHGDNDDDVQAALQAPAGSARVLHTEEHG